MSNPRWRTALIVMLRVAITVLFVPALLAKLRHPHEWAELFASWGYPSWGAVAVSCAEIVSLVLLWIPRRAAIGVAVLAITLTGATGTWLIHGPRATAAYPGTILALLVSLAGVEALARRQSDSRLETATP
jgi:hypothetical protein